MSTLYGREGGGRLLRSAAARADERPPARREELGATGAPRGRAGRGGARRARNRVGGGAVLDLEKPPDEGPKHLLGRRESAPPLLLLVPAPLRLPHLRAPRSRPAPRRAGAAGREGPSALSAESCAAQTSPTCRESARNESAIGRCGPPRATSSANLSASGTLARLRPAPRASACARAPARVSLDPLMGNVTYVC